MTAIFRPLLWPWLALLLLGHAAAISAAEPATPEHWVGTWAASPQLAEPGNLPPPPGFVRATLRQTVHVSLGGKKLRVRFSNEFGNAPLVLASARLARSAGAGAIDPATDRPITFDGRPAVAIPPGARAVSDVLEFDLAPLSDVAITVQLENPPKDLTSHPGSRATSYFQTDGNVSAPEMPAAIKIEHWYFISGLDVLADNSAAATTSAPASAIVTLGDSITDGRGSTTDGNNRWPDNLARRLQANPATRDIAVLNHGIGGNRLLRDGLGPSALARLDRDVLAQTGARWLMVFEGINDIGTRLGARKNGMAYASAADIIAAYEQIITRARARGLRVIGATITPYAGADFYWSADGEADRQQINEWIRTSGRYDAVIDFDAAVRDPANPTHLAPAYDCGDHLHLSPAGYQRLAEVVDLGLFTQ